MRTEKKEDHSILYFLVIVIFLSTCGSCDREEKIQNKLDIIEKKIDRITSTKE